MSVEPTAAVSPRERATAPVVVLTQGDPAGIGPELLLRLAASPVAAPWRPLAIVEQAALRAVAHLVPGALERVRFFAAPPDPATLASLPAGTLAAVDPVGRRRTVVPGEPGAADAHGAMAAIDLALDLVAERHGEGEPHGGAILTLPVAKATIARHVRPDFVGHTEYLAERAGLHEYGRDFLMAFLAPELRVALLSTHLPLRAALERVTPAAIGQALALLARHSEGRIAVAGLNPHAGEGGLLGIEDARDVAPAVAAARGAGLDVAGPESPDSLFARARRGEFAWVLALYHDQGLIAVKTASFGTATNWTLGLPFLRTSVDHGTAFDRAGKGIADDGPLRAVVATTLAMLEGRAGVRPVR